jgi:hypothetical protein
VFHINGINQASVKKVDLLSLSGEILKTWNGAQVNYDIEMFAKVSYVLKITPNKDTPVQFIKITR